MAKLGITSAGSYEHDGSLTTGVSIKLSVTAATISPTDKS